MDRGKWIILGGVAALIPATLFPPWHCRNSVDAGLLLVEYVLVVLVTAALYFVFRERREAAWRKLDRGKRIILGGAAVLLLGSLFPPWTVTYPSGDGETVLQIMEYGFLLSPPTTGESVSLDLSMLLVEWAVFAIDTATLYFVFRPKRQAEENL